jgi:inosine/xanthosine triphosphatase
MYIFVGSTNPIKINAVKRAVAEHWPTAEIHEFEIDSGVSVQPMGDKETRQGAENRARAVLLKGQTEFSDVKEVLGLGLEGGVFEHNGELWSTVWAAVIDTQGNTFVANGARFRLPKQISDLIKAGGELGPVVAKISGIEDVRKKQGMIGLVTQNFVTREEEYASIAKLAIGLWQGREWTRDLEK